MEVQRTFKAKDRNGNEQEFELKAPTLSEENEGERQYRIAYSQALVQGVFPREKLREVMTVHGMWTAIDEKALKTAVAKIAILQVELHTAEAAGDEKKCLDIAKAIGDSRKRMWELFLVQQSVYMNSAEGYAEMIKIEAIMASCVLMKNSNMRYWKDYSEYVLERDLNSKSTVYSTTIEIQAKILDQVRRGLLSDYPEARYLKTVEDRVIEREIEEEVIKTLKTRATDALAKEEVKTTKKKKNVKVANKSD